MNKNSLPSIVLTGASGFIGSSLKNTLSKNYRIIELSTNNLHNLTNDKIYFEKIKTELSNLSIHAIIHLAAYVHKRNFFPNDRTKSFIYFSNVEVTRKLAELSQDLNNKKFIFASTVGIYGPGSIDPDITYSTYSPTFPHNLYSASKLSAEFALQSVFSNNPECLIILRISSVLSKSSPGPLKYIRFFANNSIPFPVFSIENDPIPLRNFVVIEDLNRYIIQCLTNDSLFGKIHNVSTKNYSVKELIKFFTAIKSKNAFFHLKLNRNFVKILLKIPIFKSYLSPLVLNHKL